jgi:DNA-binding transcriptional LysR family regulator
MERVNLADLELRHLIALRAVAEEGTFAKAGRRLGFTQSAISQQVAALERTVGEPVFDRPGGPRPVRLTPCGRVLLRHAVDILDRVNRLEIELHELRSATGGRLAIGMFQSVSVRIVPGVLSELRQRRPGVDFVLFESDSEDELVDKVRSGDLDLTFTVHADYSDLVIEPLFDDPFLVVCPLDSPIVPRRGPVRLDTLDGLALIGQPPTACQSLIEDGLRARGVHGDYVFRAVDNGTVQAMVAAGVGHAVMARLALDLSDPNVIIRETVPAIPHRTIGLAYVAGRTLSPIAREFIETTRRQTALLEQRTPPKRRSRSEPAA